MNSLTIFNFENQQVRTVINEGQPWFVAKDLCDILEISNSRDVFARISDTSKGVAIIDTPGGRQSMNTVNEAGMYKLVFTSRKPEAEKFTEWVTSEVLPSIRKYGVYATGQLSPHLQVLNQMVQAMAAIELQSKQLTERVDKQEQAVAIVKETFLHRDENWRKNVNRLLNSAAKDTGEYQTIKAHSYHALENRAGCSLNTRLHNMRRRLAASGATKTATDSMNRLDVIEQDKRLREIYDTVCKEIALARA